MRVQHFRKMSGVRMIKVDLATHTKLRNISISRQKTMCEVIKERI